MPSIGFLNFLLYNLLVFHKVIFAILFFLKRSVVNLLLSLIWQHFFTSFLSRDEAHRLIVDRWSQHNSNAKALIEQQVHLPLYFVVVKTSVICGIYSFSFNTIYTEVKKVACAYQYFSWLICGTGAIPILHVDRLDRYVSLIHLFVVC